jgi:hypothetical protein
MSLAFLSWETKALMHLRWQSWWSCDGFFSLRPQGTIIIICGLLNYWSGRGTIRRSNRKAVHSSLESSRASGTHTLAPTAPASNSRPAPLQINHLSWLAIKQSLFWCLLDMWLCACQTAGLRSDAKLCLVSCAEVTSLNAVKIFGRPCHTLGML